MPEIGTSGSMSGDGKRSVAAWPKLPRPSSTLPKRRTGATHQFGRYRSESGHAQLPRPNGLVAFCEGFRMPAHDGGATYTGGRRTKTSRGGNRDGGASRRLGRYGDSSAVEGEQQRRLRTFRRLTCTGDAPASGLTGSMGEDWRAGTGGNAMSPRAPSWPVENQLRVRAAFQRGGLGVDVMRCRS
jgi:hypothetical protein